MWPWRENNTNRRKIITWALIAVLLLVGILWRVRLAGQLPLINDEQAFAYDAVLFDVRSPLFWKSSLLVVLERVWLEIAGWESVVSVRVPVLLWSVAGLALLAWCARQMAGKAAGFGTLVVGMLFAPALAHSVPALSEHMMLLPVALLTAAVLLARRREKIPVAWLIGISALLGLVVLARWSGIFWFLPTLGLLFTPAKKEMGRRFVWLTAPFVVAGCAFLLVTPGVVQGFDVKGEFLRFFEDSSQRGWMAKWSAWIVPLTRFLPFWLLGIVAVWGTNRARQAWGWGLLTFVVAAFVPVLLAGDRVPTYEAGSWLSAGLLVLIVGAGTLYEKQHGNRALREAFLLLIPPLIAYAIFSKVNEKYLAEFLPGAVVLAGLGLGRMFEAIRGRQWALGVVSLVLLVSWLTPWYPYIYEHPYAGTLSLPVVYETVDYLKHEAKEGDAIVTGAVLIPLLAEREPAFKIPHPAWTYPTFRGEENPRFELTYGPVADALEAGKIDFFLDEKLTTDTYRNHPRIVAALAKHYRVVAEFTDEISVPVSVLRPK